MPWKIPEDIKLSECHMYWNPSTKKGGTVWVKLMDSDPNEFYFVPRDENMKNRFSGHWFDSLDEAKRYVERFCGS